MKIPKRVKIGGHWIRVREGEFSDDNLCSGTCSYVNAEIVINKDLEQTQKEAALIHEAMHVMNTTMDHALLDSLAEQVYQFLKDNKLI